jgi:hypothetical protein
MGVLGMLLTGCDMKCYLVESVSVYPVMCIFAMEFCVYSGSRLSWAFW